MGLKQIIAFTIIGAYLSGVLTIDDDSALESKIVGGYLVENRSDFAYQVSIRYIFGAYHFCGGAIIHPRAVLTAAHCVEASYFSPLTAYLVAGDLTTDTLTSTSREIAVKSSITHADYNPYTIVCDIGLIITEEEIVFNTWINMIPLATVAPEHNETAIISGWGTLSAGGSASTRLMYAEVPIVAKEICSINYGELILDGMLCAGFMEEGGVDACQGDSGGPLVVDNTLAGIVSWGNSCALAGYPGVYSDVAYFREWILTNLEAALEEENTTTVVETTTPEVTIVPIETTEATEATEEPSAAHTNMGNCLAFIFSLISVLLLKV